MPKPDMDFMNDREPGKPSEDMFDYHAARVENLVGAAQQVGAEHGATVDMVVEQAQNLKFFATPPAPDPGDMDLMGVPDATPDVF